MRKLLSLLSIFAVVLSCSSDETSTPVTPPPAPVAKYTITLSAGQGGTVSTTGGEYEAGQTVSVTATPQGEYVFTSWSDGNTDATRTITVSSNSTLTANFEKRKYPLTINFEGEGEVIEEIVNAGRTTEYDSGTTVKLTAQASAEWVFIGWTGDIESTEESVQIVIGEPKEVTATFEKKKYSITINIEGEGEVLEEIVNTGRTTDYDIGTTLKLTAIPAEGWEFIEWIGASNENPLIITPPTNSSYTAVFEESLDYFVSKAPNYPSINLSVGKVLRNQFSPNKLISFAKNNIFYANAITNEVLRAQGRAYVHFDYNKDDFLDLATILVGNNQTQSGLLLIDNIYGSDKNSYFLENDKTSKPINYHFSPFTVIGDVNNDGNNDLIIGSHNSHSAYDSFGNLSYGDNKPFEIYLFQEDGSFIINEITLPTSVHDFDTGDIDNDGDVDLVFITYRQDKDLTNHRSGYPYIYLNDGLGNFTKVESETYFEGLSEITGNKQANEAHIFSLSTRLFDLDNDDILDLLIGGAFDDVPNQYTPTPRVLWGQGNGKFSFNEFAEFKPSQNLESVRNNFKENNEGIAILGFSYVDYDKDGFYDVLISGTPDYNGTIFMLFKNNGDKTFTDVTSQRIDNYINLRPNRSGPTAYDVFVNDYDNDGDFDLLPDLNLDFESPGFYYENIGGQFIRKENN
ncbi:VCBS repeat-containing protein [Flavobacteriaceae bacterium]|nr:VCBS repeat-containing protein [Flavobacteriaceae bacterium]